MRQSTWFFALLPVGLALSGPSWAQQARLPGAVGGSGFGDTQTAAPARPAEPAALPGAQRRAAPAPLTKAPSQMGPNEALFDSVNRGDIAAARDAVARGADLRARNALGLTALELAVDLGQNDIAFMLLSQRDADSGPRPTAGPGVRTVATKPPPARTVAPVRSVRATPQRPAQSDGGAPVPSAGFLGFGR